jgi:hypothetical protein
MPFIFQEENVSLIFLSVLLVVHTSLQELNESTILAIAVGKGPII